MISTISCARSNVFISASSHGAATSTVLTDSNRCPYRLAHGGPPTSTRPLHISLWAKRHSTWRPFLNRFRWIFRPALLPFDRFRRLVPWLFYSVRQFVLHQFYWSLQLSLHQFRFARRLVLHHVSRTLPPCGHPTFAASVASLPTGFVKSDGVLNCSSIAFVVSLCRRRDCPCLCLSPLPLRVLCFSWLPCFS